MLTSHELREKAFLLTQQKNAGHFCRGAIQFLRVALFSAHASDTEVYGFFESLFGWAVWEDGESING
ncbi:hypothetical protein SAMN05444141_102556 [Pseudovibrio denitrificans]|uniref:Uncharacterized protein n=1 Tax=Pseudovibrio denitrificans TaxID=258256 RepID=A0A1I6ZRX0_9HYPH|nr:hypothetical protein SAMN05444141_102556 [Pseudovibrio denitrificans]